MQGWTLPTTVTVGGKPYAVHTDYRDILDIIDHLQNTDDNEQERWYIAMALFYENWRDIPAQNRQEAAERMAEFIACGKTQGILKNKKGNCIPLSPAPQNTLPLMAGYSAEFP